MEQLNIGININDSSQPFTEQILNGEKTIETRNSINNALQSYIGKRVGIVRTGTGNTKVVGYATIGNPIHYTSEKQFREDENKHLVTKGSPFDIRDEKYGYPMIDVERCEPYKPWKVSIKTSILKDPTMSFREFYETHLLTEATAETEVERLLFKLLPSSPYKNLVHAVGGYVRDQYRRELLNDPSINPNDLDIVVELEDGAKKVTHYLRDILGDKVTAPYQLGAYPIWAIVFNDDVEYKGETFKTKGAKIEFADTQEEYYPDRNSRQRQTRYASLQKDIERRDFTMNMLIKNLTTGEILDMTGYSKEDIKNKIIRGNPNVSFDKILDDDALRMVRFIRFQAKYDLTAPAEAVETIKRNAERIKTISNERISTELFKIMNAGKLYDAVKMMDETGLLHYILPEIEELKGIQQNPEHHKEGDAYIHTLMVLKNAEKGPLNQLAALLHDVGKAKVTTTKEDKIISHGHDAVGSVMAGDILNRLKMFAVDDIEPNIVDKVKTVVKFHMRPYELIRINADAKTIRRFIRDVGSAELVTAVLNLASADERGKIPPSNNIPALRQKIEEAGIEIPKPILKGDEVMALLGLKTGTEVGRAMKILKDLQDEFGTGLTKEKAKEELLRRF